MAIIAIAAVLGAAAFGFYFLEDYVSREKLGQSRPTLELLMPAWVNRTLEDKVYAAATAYLPELVIDEDTAKAVYEGLSEKLVWLTDTKVQVSSERVVVSGRWRRPIAVVSLNRQDFYVDQDLVLLDYVGLSEMLLPEIRGLRGGSGAGPGVKWDQPDLRSAVRILLMLHRMDRQLAAENPLLAHIKAIDVTNYDGRDRRSNPHIVLYAQDDTQIIWGAEPERWQRHAEASDQEKLGKLYRYYKQFGTLQTGVRYIDLRQPQGRIRQPGERF